MTGFVLSGIGLITSIGGNIYRKEGVLALARRYPRSPHGIVLRLYDTLYPETPNFLHLGFAQSPRDVGGLVSWDHINFVQIRVKFSEKIENYEAVVHSRVRAAAWISVTIAFVGLLLSVAIWNANRVAIVFYLSFGLSLFIAMISYSRMMDRVLAGQRNMYREISNERVLRVFGDIIMDPYYGKSFKLSEYMGFEKSEVDGDVNYALKFSGGKIEMVSLSLRLYEYAGDANIDYILKELDSLIRERKWQHSKAALNAANGEFEPSVGDGAQAQHLDTSSPAT